MAADKTAPPQARTYTVDEFLALDFEGDTRYELHDGELIEVPPPKGIHIFIMKRLVLILSAFVDPRQLGHVWPDGFGYIIGERKFYIPDASFISFTRLPEIPDYAHVAPELAVEVLSPSNTHTEIRAKVRAFLEAGTEVVWVIDPARRLLDAHQLQPNGDIIIRTYPETANVSGVGVLSGFSFTLQDILPPAHDIADAEGS